MARKGRKISRTILLLTADVLGVVASAIFAYVLMSLSDIQKVVWDAPIWIWVAANVVLALTLFYVFGLYKIVWASVSIVDALRMLLVAVLVGLANLTFALITQFNYHIGVSVSVVYAVLLLCYTGAFRFSKRVVILYRRAKSRKKSDQKRVIIIGAGEAGAMLVKEMLFSDKIAYKPVCFLDDNVTLRGRRIHNVLVAGNTYGVKAAAEKYRADEILVALPSVKKSVQKEIVHRCSECGLPIRVLPGLYQLAEGQVSVSSLRSVDVRDLLGREPISVNLDEIMGYIENQTVLVTGGGGSIGSELCRQIASHSPKELIILDIYENNAYDIEQELQRTYPQLHLLTLIASVRDKSKIEDVFKKYRPDIVFNAAAPMLVARLFYRRLHEGEEDKRFLDLLINFSTVNFVVYMLATRGTTMARISMYTSLYNALLIPYFLRIFKKESRLTAKLLLMAMFGLYMIMILPVDSQLLPYQNSFGWYFA